MADDSVFNEGLAEGKGVGMTVIFWGAISIVIIIVARLVWSEVILRKKRHFVIVKNDGVIQVPECRSMVEMKKEIEKIEADSKGEAIFIQLGQFIVLTNSGYYQIGPNSDINIYRVYGPFKRQNDAVIAAKKLMSLAGSRPDNIYKYIVYARNNLEMDHIEKAKKLGAEETEDKIKWPELPVFYEGLHKEEADFGKILDCGDELPEASVEHNYYSYHGAGGQEFQWGVDETGALYLKRDSNFNPIRVYPGNLGEEGPKCSPFLAGTCCTAVSVERQHEIQDESLLAEEGEESMEERMEVHE